VLIEGVGTAARPERLEQRPGHEGILARRAAPAQRDPRVSRRPRSPGHGRPGSAAG